ncbi:MAG: SulP family inorganic anion transporter [Ruminiclostridium sp.]|nr:SulP family inorganic anion transporter [Ruminiclostridium sp.]MBQ8841025.1 SulP family inorganic anion transporter [Ruminiclostridium sp.]
MNLAKRYVRRLKTEFSGYNGKKFGKDLLAGITVAAVALPLALAFGVSSGADAASGLVTALMAGLIMGVFSGASYQISGPTGAMSAILISLVAQHGLNGVFIACLISGVILLICGIFKLGGIVSFIPTPVITGFTSGIAIIIAFGQINNLTGLTSEGESTIDKLISYFTLEQSFNMTSFLIGLAVIVFMFIYPKKLNGIVPSSLVAIILATIANFIFKFDVSVVGEIPKTLFLENRLDISAINWSEINGLIIPAVSIAALGLIESLLCGASAGRMKNEPIDSDMELVAQGLGNIIIPFFGGVPATAAIARTSVAIKAGGQTRLTSIIHSVVLILSMFLLGGVMSKIPLAALAGVLIVTAVRMNEFEVIKDIFGRKIKTAMFQFLITMVATVIFDLTIAIIIGVLFSVIMFVLKVSEMTVNISGIRTDNMDVSEKALKTFAKTRVAYITGPLYFGTANKLRDRLKEVVTDDEEYVIFSVRGVPIADLSGVSALNELCDELMAQNKKIYFSCVNPTVTEMFQRCGLEEKIGKDNFFWSTDKVLDYLGKED